MHLKWNTILLIIIILLLIFLLYVEIGNRHRALEFYFSELLCNMLVTKDEKNCINELINDYNFFYYDISIKKNMFLYIDNNKSLIENLFILIGLIPFLKHNSTLEFKVNGETINKSFKIQFNYKSIKNASYIFDTSDFEIIKKKLNDLINYKWEFLPSKKILDIIRYIINNYYDDSSNSIFEEALNKNYEYFIQNNKSYLSNKEMKQLMSK
jgi:hypothetical protein